MCRRTSNSFLSQLSSPQFRVEQQVKLAALNLICNLPDDILIYLFRFLDVPHIISLRKTSRKLQDISRLRIIWVNALTDRILPPCYPFPLDFRLDNVSSSSVLESSVRRAYLLGKQWFSEKPFSCDVLYDFDATKGTPITDLRFIPGYDGTWIITVSKSIWSVMTVWELRGTPRHATKKFEWSQRDCLLQSFVLNDEGAAEATLAIAVVREGHSYIDIMSLSTDSGFHSLTIVESTLCPVYLHGDIIVLSNSSDSSLVMNWKTGESALLVSASHATATGLSLNNKCIQILFAPEAILVVRARGLTVFPNPPLTADPPVTHAPFAVHSFGWVDGVAVTWFIDPSSPSSRPHPSERDALHILIRPEADDPWATHTDYELQLFTLHPDSPSPSPSSSHFPPPYTSPPILTASVSAIRGALRYGDLHFGRYGTAVWIEPQDRSAAGLTHDPYGNTNTPIQRMNERIVCAAFPGGPLSRRDRLEQASGEASRVRVRSHALLSNERNDWNALDYDEARGLVVAGSRDGRLVVLSLV